MGEPGLKVDRRSFIGAAAAGAALGSSNAALASAAAPGESPRSRTRLGAWRFHLGHAADEALDFGFGRNQRTYAKAGASTADAARADFDDSGWSLVQVPHDWAVDLPFAPPSRPVPKDGEDAAAAHGFKAIGREFPQNSIGWYRTAIEIEPADRARIVSLEFDGVFRDCLVFVNGYILAHNDSGYAPFAVEIGDFLDYDGGPNVVAVRADASLGEGWFYEGAGIYRHVDLVRTGLLHIPQGGVFVRAMPLGGGARIQVTLEVDNRADAARPQLRQWVIGPDGERAGELPDLPIDARASARTSVDRDLTLSAARSWSPESPALYRLVSEIRAGDTILDRCETRFGIRSIAFDAERGFLLNGRPTKLLGSCNHHDHAGVGTGIPDALHRWRVDQLKGMGSNAWRSAHNPPATSLLDAADELGMMMIVEMRRNSSDPDSMGELERTVRRDRNHPCVIAWSLGNEEPHQGTERGARITAAMQARVRTLDSSRPTTFAMDNSWEKGIGKVVDVVGFNYRTNQMEAFHAAHPLTPIYGSETGSTVSTRGAYANDAAAHVVRAYDTEHPWWATTAEEWWTIAAAHPFIAGGFVWTGFDYRGEPTPYGSWPSVSSYFGVLDLCGFPKDNYFYYRSWWRPGEPLVHLLPHWTWPGREGQPVEVWVHGNCAEVELLLNGRSLGRKAMPRNRHLAWDVAYAPGRLEARGYDARGTLAARDERRTAGAPHRLVLSTDRNRLVADGRDLAMVRVEVLDRAGVPVPTAAVPVAFGVEGGGAVIGVGNGDPTSHEPDRASRRATFNGLAQAIVQARPDAGLLRIGATAPGLESAALTLPCFS